MFFNNITNYISTWVVIIPDVPTRLAISFL